MQMKTLIFTLFVFVYGCVSAQTGSFTCKLIFDSPDDPNLNELTIELKGTSIARFILLEKKTEFSTNNLQSDTISIHISDLGCRDTVISNVVVKSGETTMLEVHFPSTCEYDKSVNDKTCPVCGKKDKSIPVEYGLLIHKNKRAQRKFEKNPTFYAAACEITCCNPHWYCKRDKKSF